MASLDQAAAHVFISSQRFREMLARGAIKKAGRGKYNLDKVREQYIRYLSAQAAGRDTSGGSLTEERTRLVAAKRRREERADLIEAGTVVPFAPIVKFLQAGLLVMRDRLLCIAGAHAFALAMQPQAECYRLVDDAIREALEEIASPDFCERCGGGPCSGEYRATQRQRPERGRRQ